MAFHLSKISFINCFKIVMKHKMGMSFYVKFKIWIFSIKQFFFIKSSDFFIKKLALCPLIFRVFHLTADFVRLFHFTANFIWNFRILLFHCWLHKSFSCFIFYFVVVFLLFSVLLLNSTEFFCLFIFFQSNFTLVHKIDIFLALLLISHEFLLVF